MRRLILLRHAKAANHAGGGDSERPLTGRRRADASRTGRYLASELLIPDMALVSHAKRTRETLELVLAELELGVRIPIHVEPRLYNADPLMLAGLLRDTPERIRTLLLVGHNPGISELAQDLVGSGDRYARKRMEEGFPTSALAVLDFSDDDWSSVASGRGRLDRFVQQDDLAREP